MSSHGAFDIQAPSESTLFGASSAAHGRLAPEAASPHAPARSPASGPVANLDYASHYVDHVQLKAGANPDFASRGLEAKEQRLRKFNALTGGSCLTHGVIDPKKVMAWQKRHGLDETGVIDADEVNVADPSKRAALEQGKLDNEFSYYMTLLPELNESVDEDGFHSRDRNWREKLKPWQAKHGLAPTGAVNAATVDAAQRASRVAARGWGKTRKDDFQLSELPPKERAKVLDERIHNEFNWFTSGGCTDDGYFGLHKRISEKKLKLWQRKHEVKETGVLDDATLAAAKRYHRAAMSLSGPQLGRMGPEGPVAPRPGIDDD